MEAQSERIHVNRYFVFLWVGVSAAAYLIVLIAIHFLFGEEVGYRGWNSIIVSLLLGIGQWLLLRRYVPAAGWWFIITFIVGISSFASVYEVREVLRIWPDVVLVSSIPTWFQEFVGAISGNQYIDIVIAYILLVDALFGIRILWSFGLILLQWLFLRQNVTGAWKWIIVMPIVIILTGLITTVLVNVYIRMPIGIRELYKSLWFKVLVAGLFQVPVLMTSGFVMKNLLEKPKQHLKDFVSL